MSKGYEADEEMVDDANAKKMKKMTKMKKRRWKG